MKFLNVWDIFFLFIVIYQLVTKQELPNDWKLERITSLYVSTKEENSPKPWDYNARNGMKVTGTSCEVSHLGKIF